MPRLQLVATLWFFIICSFLSLSAPAQASNDILKKLYLKEKKAKEIPEGITLSGEFGALTASGNTNTTTFKAALSSEHEMRKWSNSYHTQVIYKQNKTETSTFVSAQRFLVNAQLDYKLPSINNRLFIYAEYEDDRFNGFRYQTAVAAGYSSHAWKNKESQFRYSIGPGYSYSEREITDAEKNKSFDVFKEMIIRASVDYNLSISKSAKFRQFMSTEAGQETNRSRSETSLTASIIESLAMKLSFVMIYNDGTLQTNEDLSTETSISMVYQFF